MDSWSPSPIEPRGLSATQRQKLQDLRIALAADLAHFAVVEHDELAEQLKSAQILFGFVPDELCDLISETARHAFDEQLENFSSRPLRSEDTEYLAAHSCKFYIRNIAAGGYRKLESFILTRD